ncbi:AMP-dependent synthetase/ligase [Flaviflexus massiliensis]|uniref:AMP-dependent synthetase/ligase n=1 Tax=Flaviflexus massiliensis TaxID=1522309 RepID=UPI000A8C3BA9|nr:long-chain fatty acid--CoA ligase [Flaviflexus massiliensis]
MMTTEDRQVSYTEGKHKVREDQNIAKMLRDRTEQNPNKVAVETKTALGEAWVPVTYRQFEDTVRAIARGFIALGIQPGDRVAIMSPTRYEWNLFDFALWYAGACGIPIYETSSRSQAEWILSDSGCRAIIVENAALRDTVAPLLNSIDGLNEVFVIDEDAVDKIIAKGEELDITEADRIIDERIGGIKADDLATIIYTSGTTGRPKGTLLTHRNLLHVVYNGPADPDLQEIVAGDNTRTLLFLPMAHVFARFISILTFETGTVIGHSPDTKNLVADMQSFKPTFVLAVPRVFEKVYNAADAKANSSKVKGPIFRRFAKVAIAYSRALQTPQGPSPWLKAQHSLGDKLVYSTLKELLGGELKHSISGGGPLGERLGHFFRGAGITIYEGYGLTETSAPTTVNRPGHLKVGTIGHAYPGCLVSIDDDGEILVKGDHVTPGYYNNEEATKAAFTEDGWFRTGDLGSMDDEGYVTITGRKKEIIVTAGGKNVAPAILEDRLRGHPIVSQVVVVGDNRPFIGALITLDADMLPGWLSNKGLEPMSIDEAARNPQVIAALDRAVTRANDAVSRAESIRKFNVLTTDFTVDNDYLTPSLKVKRHKVLTDFSKEIDWIYDNK